MKGVMPSMTGLTTEREKTRFYNQHHKGLLEYVIRNFAKANSREDAEEITNNVFVNILTDPPALKNPEHTELYMIAAARNAAINFYESPANRYSHTGDFTEYNDELHTPEAQDIDMDFFVVDITDLERECFLLVELQGYTIEQAALRMGRSTRSVERIRAMVRNRLNIGSGLGVETG